jgi:hypothetical protein
MIYSHNGSLNVMVVIGLVVCGGGRLKACRGLVVILRRHNGRQLNDVDFHISEKKKHTISYIYTMIVLG